MCPGDGASKTQTQSVAFGGTTRIDPEKAVENALLIFLGQLGLHRFYLERVGTGITQLLLGLVGWATAAFVVGFLFLGVLWIWLFVDLFLIPGMVREANLRTQ